MNPIIKELQDKKIVILGFGREGRSSYEWIRKHLPKQKLTIADQSDLAWNYTDENVELICGEHYIQGLNQYDLILKSPGISFSKLNYSIEKEKISSQVELFLKYYKTQTIGITGTKGKSTTSTLLHHILENATGNTFLAGNIGKPVFEILDQINSKTWVVIELSAHQLEFVQHAPHISILLNLFQEHLDHFHTFEHYIKAKLNIALYQNKSDYLIYNEDDLLIKEQLKASNYQSNRIPFSKIKTLQNGIYHYKNEIIICQKEGNIHFPISILSNLRGTHNINNGMAAIMAARLLSIPSEKIENAVQQFHGLEHRLEQVGTYNGITFFNDSISTVPEAAISALASINNVETIILGGFDRGIDYSSLYNYLKENPVKNIIFTGPAGERMAKEILECAGKVGQYFMEENFSTIIDLAFQYTSQGASCVLSPAASSYNAFKNFEERGTYFKQLIHDYKI